MIIAAIISAVVGIASLVTQSVMGSKSLSSQIGITKEMAIIQNTQFLKDYESGQQTRYLIVLVTALLLIGLLIYSLTKRI